jgi:hypothetical protein
MSEPEGSARFSLESSSIEPGQRNLSITFATWKSAVRVRSPPHGCQTHDVLSGRWLFLMSHRLRSLKALPQLQGRASNLASLRRLVSSSGGPFEFATIPVSHTRGTGINVAVSAATDLHGSSLNWGAQFVPAGSQGL